jgi:DNA invertase Pin-like site-specific DNA recombinase
MSKVYGYGRVSTEDQSLDVQKAALEAAGCNVVMLETASGASREGRPKLQLLLDVLGPDDVLIVTKLDRLARDTIDMLELAKEIGAKGAGMKSLAESWADTTSAAGELILTIMAGVAQFERARIKERQKEGIERARREGVYKGGVKRFDDVTIRRMVADGRKQAEIARELGCDPKTVQRALRTNQAV